MSEHVSAPRRAWHADARALWAWRLRRLRTHEERQYGDIALSRTTLSLWVQRGGDEKQRFRRSSYEGTIEAALSYVLKIEGIEDEEDDQMSESQGAINEAQMGALASIAVGGPLPHHKTLAALERRGLIARDGEAWKTTAAGDAKWLEAKADPDAGYAEWLEAKEWREATPEKRAAIEARQARDDEREAAPAPLEVRAVPEIFEIEEGTALRALRYIVQEIPAARRVVVLFAELERATEALKDGSDVG